LNHIKNLKEKEITDLIIAPIGFISDHMEIIYDLDTQAKNLCIALGINLVRSATVGTHPRFIKMIKELVDEYIDPAQPQSLCLPHCCPITTS